MKVTTDFIRRALTGEVEPRVKHDEKSIMALAFEKLAEDTCEVSNTGVEDHTKVSGEDIKAVLTGTFVAKTSDPVIKNVRLALDRSVPENRALNAIRSCLDQGKNLVDTFNTIRAFGYKSLNGKEYKEYDSFTFIKDLEAYGFLPKEPVEMCKVKGSLSKAMAKLAEKVGEKVAENKKSSKPFTLQKNDIGLIKVE